MCTTGFEFLGRFDFPPLARSPDTLSSWGRARHMAQVRATLGKTDFRRGRSNRDHGKRAAVVAFGRPEGDAALAPHEPIGRTEAERYGAARSCYWTWAAVMRRAFDLDVLRCPRCAGRLELIATIDDPAVIHRILAYLALPGAREGPALASAVSPPRTDQPVFPFALPL